MEFKEIFISEDTIAEKVESDADEWGFNVYGEYITINVNKAQHNSLTEFEARGKAMVSKFKSNDYIKGEYKEEDWNKLDKLYKEAMTKASKDVAKGLVQFEKILDGAFKDLAKFSKQF